MTPDLWSLYRIMLKSRLFEEAVARIWENGKISGEMHLGTGEEGIIAGVADHLREGDAMALDHRGTAALLMRGVDPELLLKEFLGHSDGLCRGRGGHMHLFSPQHLAASSGIVGASGPAAVGFALAAVQLRPETVAVAFFGDGAVNQGMLMESFNLAVAWRLPVLFVCKDNDWAITTRSRQVTGGNLIDRIRGFGMPAAAVDGSSVEDVWFAAQSAVESARSGEGPAFLLASCRHIEGHFLGDPLHRIARHPVKEMTKMTGPMLQSAAKWKGESLHRRAESFRVITALVGKTIREKAMNPADPLKQCRQKLKVDKQRLSEIEESEIDAIKMLVKVVNEDPH